MQTQYIELQGGVEGECLGQRPGQSIVRQVHDLYRPQRLVGERQSADKLQGGAQGKQLIAEP